jgi:hypothetical protein
MYGIRISDLRYYLLFGLMICPFQVMIDMIINNATEIAHGVKIYDYMMYAKYRWNNRLVRWLFDDPRFDKSVNETVQSTNHLCFCPQYYFILTYYTWGIILIILAITVLIRAEINPLEDPAFVYFVMQQFLANRVLDKVIKIVTFIIWQPPKASKVAKKFYRDVMRNLKQREQELHSHIWRAAFYNRHKGWILANLDQVFTPRSIQRYKHELSGTYQSVLNLQPELNYQVLRIAEEKIDVPAQIEDDTADDEILMLMRYKQGALPAIKDTDVEVRNLELEEKEKIAKWPLYRIPGFKEAPQDEEGVTPFTALALTTWMRIARRHVEMLRLAEQWRFETNQLPYSETCGVQGDDQKAFDMNVSPWAPLGPKLRIYESQNMPSLCSKFEEKYCGIEVQQDLTGDDPEGFVGMSLSGANISDKRIKEELKDPRHRMVLAELDAATLKSPAFIDPKAQSLMPVGMSNQSKLKVEDTMTLMFSKNKEQL